MSQPNFFRKIRTALQLPLPMMGRITAGHLLPLPQGCFQGSGTYKKPLFTGTNCTLLPLKASVPPKADIGWHHSNVCFVPKTDISQRTRHVR